MTRSKVFLVIIATIALLNINVKAQTITAISPPDTPTVVNSIPITGTGDSGYYIYGLLPSDLVTGYVNVANPQTFGSSSDAGIDGLESWATVSFSNSGNSYAHTTDSLLTISGTQYQTVENFGTVTLTLGSGTPAEFTLGVLANNTSDGTDGIVVSTPAGTPTQTVTITDEYQPDEVNDFYYFNIMGAASGDTFTIGSGGGAGIGGFTLSADESVVPEPSTYALMSLGLGLLIIVLRRSRI